VLGTHTDSPLLINRTRRLLPNLVSVVRHDRRTCPVTDRRWLPGSRRQSGHCGRSTVRPYHAACVSASSTRDGKTALSTKWHRSRDDRRRPERPAVV